MRYYVVSDIHSFYTPFMKALDESGFFTDTEPHRLILCGDFWDRGDEPQKIQNALSDFLDDGAVLIRGNHEDLMLDLLYFIENSEDPSLAFNSHYERNGTLKTLCDMTGATLSDIVQNPKSVVSAMRDTVMLKKIIPATLDYFETNQYVFVHGWIPCRESNAKLGEPAPTFNDWRNASPVDWKCARWMDYLTALDCGINVPQKTVVCGHRSVRYGNFLYLGIDEPDVKFNPFYYKGLIAIDATTVLSGKVNCIVLEDT